MLPKIFSGIRTQSFFQCLCWSCFGTEQGVKEGEKKCPLPVRISENGRKGGVGG